MKKDHVALTPPMGWNSWDCYGPAVNEVQLLGNARYMAEHLKAHSFMVSASKSDVLPKM